MCVLRRIGLVSLDTIIMQKKRKTVAAQMKADAVIARRNAEKARREVAEDKYWEEAMRPKSRAALKREESANKRAKAIGRIGETRRLEREQKKFLQLQKTANKKKTAGNNYYFNEMTISSSRPRLGEEKAKKAEKFKRGRSRMVSEEEYDKMVLARKTNADRWIQVLEGLSALSIDSMQPLSRRLNIFEKENMILLKETKPGLTDAQYDYRLDKLWARSHLKPDRQSRIKHLKNRQPERL